jgi:phage tail-like protein
VDANGTRFHLLLGEGDWGACVDARDGRTPLRVHFRREPATCDEASSDGELGWDGVRHELTLGACVPQFVASPNDRAPNASGAERRGAARDRYGNFYWIADSGTEIRIIPSAVKVAAHFWSAGDEVECVHEHRYGEFHAANARGAVPSLRLSGLTITDAHYLVVGVLEPAGLLVFDLHAGGPPEHVCWDNADGPFRPFDMAPRPGGGVWILDRLNRCYWALDRHLALDPKLHAPAGETPGRRDDFQPLESGEPRQTGGRIPVQRLAFDGGDPIAIDALPDGSVLILDRFQGSSRLLRDGNGWRFGTAVVVEELSIGAYDIAFVAAQPGAATLAGRLFVAASEGNQAFAYEVSEDPTGRLNVALAGEYFPMRLFGGKALVAGGDAVYYDFFDGWIPLTVRRRPRYAGTAALVTPVFDGREPGCVWHRLMLDACVPPDAAVSVRARASDERAELPLTRWQVEPAPYRRPRGSELPFVRRGAPHQDGTWELLFQHARGRYLQIELTLSGNHRVSPHIYALRAYYPRFSYLDHYLPDVYRDDEESSSFLDRFLANIEGVFTTIEDRIAAVQLLFDVRSAPAETLEWLASWLGVALDPSWSEQKRRSFIEHATEFFQRRGTTDGVKTAVSLAIDDCVDVSKFRERATRRRLTNQIRIVETYRTRRLPPAVAGDPSAVVGPRAVAIEPRWQPPQGRATLNDRYRALLRGRGVTVPNDAEFPVQPPTSSADSRLWRQFAHEALGFVPSAGPGDLDAWREFLARRYAQAGALSAVYGTGVSVAGLPLPTRLPADGAALRDWYEFESVVMAMRRTAHRFSVLLPVAGTNEVEERRRRRLELVRRIIELEKPAHTVFDVKFYWSLFRIGEARLGEDTLVDRGGRSPDLLPPLRLGEGHLAESHLTPAHPHNIADRRIVGRDPADGGSRHEEAGA